jgi:hypothetical protein
MSPYNCRRLAQIYRIVHELAMDPKLPNDHSLVAASAGLAYLVGYFSNEIEEALGHGPLR